jgi:uncharacterized protein
MNNSKFIEKLNSSYTFKGSSITLGAAILNNDNEACGQVKIPLKTINRHGLIAGATGTGKTKSLQLFTEQLSNAGVPVLVMDVKGDLSGLGAAGTANPIIEKRSKLIGTQWEGKAFPLEFLSISNEPGARMRATVSEFGPVLLSKILQLNDNQEGVLSMIFKFCDDHNLPLLDLKDLKQVLKYVQEEGKANFSKEYGLMQSTSAGAILRAIVALEQQGGEAIFGEPSFEVDDLTGIDQNGNGVINILRLTDIQNKTSLFSTFMLCLLAEIFQKMPELGDPEKPELVIFIDEAHLIFNSASKNLIDQLEMTIKLIRSKGVGIYFITQSPDDIPASILGQLGTKIQHALRAFTAKDRKAIKAAAENYPYSEFYQVDELITQLGIGEALVTTLDEKGRPTELAHTIMRPPQSRMDVLQPYEINQILAKSELIPRYNREIDRESAFEILNQRTYQREMPKQDQSNYSDEGFSQQKPTGRAPKQQSTFEQIMKSPVTTAITREVTRGLLGMLGLRTSAPRRTSTRRRY